MALCSVCPHSSLLGSRKQCGHQAGSALKVTFVTSVGLGLQGLVLYQATNAAVIQAPSSFHEHIYSWTQTLSHSTPVTSEFLKSAPVEAPDPLQQIFLSLLPHSHLG